MFTAHCIWNNELTDEDYEKIIQDTVELALKWRLISKDDKVRLYATQFGKIVASKGVLVETAAHFLSFLHKTDPSTITDLEILTLLSLSKDAYSAYIPMKARENLRKSFQRDWRSGSTNIAKFITVRRRKSPGRNLRRKRPGR